MPIDGKATTPGVRAHRGRAPRTRLAMPVIGMESEFNVLLDGEEIDPRAYWGHPLAFIEGALLPREKSSFHLPTGGAVYFDRGVIEVVTPVIELGPGATARVVGAVLAEAERTGATILAEGIESDRHLRVAQAMGATLGQGWYFGKPEPQPAPPPEAGPSPAASA